MAGEALRFRLLGAVQAWRGDEELDLGGPLQRALIAYLLLHVGQTVSRERLIDALWDADPPPRAVRSLETKVSRLRAVLGAEATVVADRGGYVLQAPVDEIDVHWFERALAQGCALLGDSPSAAKAQLEFALRLWRGDALSGIPDGLLSVERDRLESARLQAIEARIDADLALGEQRTLVAELVELRSEHPTRERFTEQLMLALYRSGRQAEALEAYRAAHRALRDDLGLEPGPRLRELEQAILRHDEALGPLPARVHLGRAVRGKRRLAAAAIGAVVLIGVVLMAASGSERRRAPPAPGLILLNAATGDIRADLPVGDSQGLSRFGYGSLWTIGSNGIMSQVDLRTRRLVRSIPVGVQAGGIATGAGGIWVTDRNGPGLLRIDPVTGEINLRARLSTLGLRRPETNGGIVLDAGSLWVVRGAEAVDRINPSSLKLQHRVMLGQSGCGAGTASQCDVAAGGGRVWVVGGASGSLTGIREATDQVIARARLRPYACCVAVGGGSVWVAEAHDIARLSPDGRLLRRFGVTSAGIGNISYDHGYLWATADTTGQLLRIGARDDHVRTIHLGNLLVGTVAGDGVVVANALPLPGAPTRGLGPRILRVGLAQDWLNVTDPAITRPASGTGRWQWQLQHATCAELYQHATCAELYQHPDASGAAGQTLRPEVAAGPPQQPPDGRTSTIPLRADLRFSPPLNRSVTANDVRSTLTRALSPELGPDAPAARILRDVVGLCAYRRGAASDIAGISLNHGALQIRTRRPMRNLARLLALPYFCVLPAGIPTPPGGYQDPVPTAAPITSPCTKAASWRYYGPTPATEGHGRGISMGSSSR